MNDSDLQNVQLINDASEYTLKNAQGDCQQYFSEDLGNESPIILKKDKYEVGMSPMIDNKTYKTSKNEQIVGDEQSIITNTLYNNDSIKTQTENNGKSVKTSLYSKLFDKTILER